MADLRVKFAGIEFRNPVWLASMGACAPWVTWQEAPEIYLKFAKRCYDYGAGAFFTGVITSEEPKYEWQGKARYHAISTPGFAERETFLTVANWPDGSWSRSMGERIVSTLKNEFRKDMPIIANIAGPGVDPDKWGNMALEIQQAGADMVELNLNCFMTVKDITEAMGGVIEQTKYHPEAGITAGMVPEVVVKILEGIRRKTNIPIIVKIAPEMSFFDVLRAAPMYQEAGAAGATASHSFIGIAPPQIYNEGKPGFAGMEKTCFCGLSGQANRFGCYTDVAAISKYTDLEVVACGGLVIPEHAIEVMMLGARAVELCSGIMWNGISFISKVIEFMNKYMDEQGYKKVDDFIGMGLNYVVEMQEQLEYWNAHPVVAQVDYIKCNRCRICQDTYCYALYWEESRPKVNTKMCAGCGLCVIRCPQNAISLRPVRQK